MQAAELSIDEAQTKICRAIADRAINIRGKLANHHTKPIVSDAVLQGGDFEIPTTINPEDLDWERSRPLRPWVVQLGRHNPAGYWDLEWIRLFREDVTKRLCQGGRVGETAHGARIEPGAMTTSQAGRADFAEVAGTSTRSLPETVVPSRVI
jgi:hypothetical protein